MLTPSGEIVTFGAASSFVVCSPPSGPGEVSVQLVVGFHGVMSTLICPGTELKVIFAFTL